MEYGFVYKVEELREMINKRNIFNNSFLTTDWLLAGTCKNSMKKLMEGATSVEDAEMMLEKWTYTCKPNLFPKGSCALSSLWVTSGLLAFIHLYAIPCSSWDTRHYCIWEDECWRHRLGITSTALYTDVFRSAVEHNLHLLSVEEPDVNEFVSSVATTLEALLNANTQLTETLMLINNVDMLRATEAIKIWVNHTLRGNFVNLPTVDFAMDSQILKFVKSVLTTDRSDVFVSTETYEKFIEYVNVRP